MRAVLIAGAAVVVVAGAYAVWSGIVPLPVGGASCARDDDLDAAWRKGPETRGEEFIAAVSAGDMAGAYAQLSAATRAGWPEAEFAATASTLVSQLADLKLQHTHRPRGEGEVSCAVDGPDGAAASMTAKAGQTQSHLLYTGKTNDNGWAVTLSLAENDGRWEVEGFFRSMTSMAGLYARDLMKMSADEAAKGHSVNAYLLALTATYRADRGDDFRLGVKAEADAALAKLPVPVEFVTALPAVWTMEGTKFVVDQVTVMNEAKLALVIVHADPAWDGKDQDGAETRNHRFIDAFLKTHPEAKDVFGTIVARMQWPGQNEAWSTVYDTATGYREKVAPETAPAPP